MVDDYRETEKLQSVFWAWQSSCTFDLRVVVTTNARSVQARVGPHPSMEREERES